MWFRNLKIYRIKNEHLNSQTLEQTLQAFKLPELLSLDIETKGWVPAKESTSNLVHKVDQQIMIALGNEKKLLPNSIINQYAKIRIAELGLNVSSRGAKIKEIKEAVRDELLSKAFRLKSRTLAWIDLESNWLVIDTPSNAKAESFLQLLRKSNINFEISSVELQNSIKQTMTEWITDNSAPLAFTIDQECELCGQDTNKSTIKYVRHPLDSQDIQLQLNSGKEVIRLALTWEGKVSFVLDQNFQLKKIKPLNIFQENIEFEEDQFDSDFVLMSKSISSLLNELIKALGGEKK